ncbi:MAG: hypothetical protein ACRYGK_13240 [Janthinobacterium lividum]
MDRLKKSLLVWLQWDHTGHETTTSVADLNEVIVEHDEAPPPTQALRHQRYADDLLLATSSESSGPADYRNGIAFDGAEGVRTTPVTGLRRQPLAGIDTSSSFSSSQAESSEESVDLRDYLTVNLDTPDRKPAAGQHPAAMRRRPRVPQGRTDAGAVSDTVAGTASIRSGKTKAGFDRNNLRDIDARILTRLSAANLRHVQRKVLKLAERSRHAEGDIELGMGTSKHLRELMQQYQDEFIQSQAQDSLELQHGGKTKREKEFLDWMRTEIMKPQTSALETTAEKKLSELDAYYKEHRVEKEFFIFLSGWVGNWACFGTGNMFSVVMGVLGYSPWSALAVPLISGLTWQFGLTWVDRLRPTTVSSPHQSVYLETAKWNYRSLRDGWQQWCGKPCKSYYAVIKNPATGVVEPGFYSASEVRASFSFTESWLKQFPSDQASYSFYCVNGFVAALFLNIFNESIYGSLPTGKTMANQMFGRLIAGGFAGGLTALTFQAVRRYFMEHKIMGFEGAVETVTKNKEVWRTEAAFLGAYIQDIEDYLEANKDNAAFKRRDRSKLNNALDGLKLDFKRASAKTTLWGSMTYDWSLWMAKKRPSVEMDTEQELRGNRIENNSSFIGKILCLMPAALVTALTASMRAPEASVESKLIAHALINIILIFPGFCTRMELAVGIHSSAGFPKGLHKGMAFLRKEYDIHLEEQDRLARRSADRYLHVARAGFNYGGPAVRRADAEDASARGPRHAPRVRFAEEAQATDQEPGIGIETDAVDAHEDDDAASAESSTAQRNSTSSDSDTSTASVGHSPEEQSYIAELQRKQAIIDAIYAGTEEDPIEKRRRLRQAIRDQLHTPIPVSQPVANDVDSSSDQRILPPGPQEDSSDVLIEIPLALDDVAGEPAADPGSANLHRAEGASHQPPARASRRSTDVEHVRFAT